MKNRAVERYSKHRGGHEFLRMTYVPFVTLLHLSVIPTNCLYHWL